NLYLKYLWCFKRIGMPPHCPIDGVVLTAAGIDGSWTASDSEDEYLSWIAVIRRQAEAKGLSLAEWEHRVWLAWRRQQNQSGMTAQPKQRPAEQVKYVQITGCAPSISTASHEFERAYEAAPICWAYDSARPRFIYLSRDNRASTQASYRFDYA